MVSHSKPYIPMAGMSAVAAAGILVALSVFPVAAGDAKFASVAVDEVKFNPGPPTLPVGAEFAVLLGNPGEEGPFVIRLKFPADYKVPPHLHPLEEHVTVISGGFGISTGEKHDLSAAPILPPGSFVRIPANEAHFAWTDQETVVQLNGMGPFTITYVNPDDDPRIN